MKRRFDLVQEIEVANNTWIGLPVERKLFKVALLKWACKRTVKQL